MTSEHDLGVGEPETGDGAAASPVEALRARIGELEDLLRRSLADMDNLRKRTTRDAQASRLDERSRVAGMWLPVVDDLERALQHADAEPASIVEGVRGIRDEALDVLGRLGFRRRDEVGEQFDPARHEAVSSVAGTDAPDGTIVHVVRPGYGGDERELRPAAVVVAKGDG